MHDVPSFSSHQDQFNRQRTSLFTREVHDAEEDFIGMELNDFSKLDRPTLEKAFNRVGKATRYIFSGSANAIINKIDLSRAMYNQR